MNADTQAASIAALEQEMKDLQSERAKVSKLRAQLEQASTRMEQEKAAWERQKARVAMLLNSITSRDVYLGILSLQQALQGVLHYCAFFPQCSMPHANCNYNGSAGLLAQAMPCTSTIGNSQATDLRFKIT